MRKSFSVTILGSNSALPTSERYPTAQVLNASERFFLIDCGEGTQRQLRKNKLSFAKINHIFISHLHGDHCFGLIGLISTMGLLGRKKELYVYSVPDLEKIMGPQLDYFCKDLPYRVVFESFNPKISEVIYTDKHIQVETIPLVHRIPTVGFLFKENEAERKIRKEFVFTHKPGIKAMRAIKRGEDFISDAGRVFLNEKITLDPPRARSYAFCTDTCYTEGIIDQIRNVDLLYHESTFLRKDEKLAKKTYHSTAEQAAQVARKANVNKLIIGHFSSRYYNLTPFLEEARVVFPYSYLAKEGSVIEVE